MRSFRILLIASIGFAVLLALGLGIAWMMTSPEPLPEGTESARRLESGPHSVGRDDFVWIDKTRPTARNGDQPGSSERRFPVALWFPEDVDRRHPLVVYSHGFRSSRYGGAYFAEHLASHGYVVVAADFPLTHADALGGPKFLDVVNQPEDVSFLIDRVMVLRGEEKPFAGGIDPERIGAFGLSLGGVTTTVVGFDPELRDRRLRAAISIAGPGDIFGPVYFDHADLPFLMIAGTSDQIIDYELNALPIPDRIRKGGLVTIVGGTHVGFDDIASGLMRVLGNPDSLICRGRRQGNEDEDAPVAENVFVGLFGTKEEGLLEPTEYRPGCTRTFEASMAAGRQRMMTTLAIRAFFESHFAREPAERAEHLEFLSQTLPSELPEVRYQASRRGERGSDR